MEHRFFSAKRLLISQTSPFLARLLLFQPKQAFPVHRILLAVSGLAFNERVKARVDATTGRHATDRRCSTQTRVGLAQPPFFQVLPRAEFEHLASNARIRIPTLDAFAQPLTLRQQLARAGILLFSHGLHAAILNGQTRFDKSNFHAPEIPQIGGTRSVASPASRDGHDGA